MNRRELLKAIPGMYVNGRLASIMYKLPPSSSPNYVVFFNPMLMGPNFGKQFMADFPGSVAYPVEVSYGGGSLDNAIRIFEESRQK